MPCRDDAKEVGVSGEVPIPELTLPRVLRVSRKSLSHNG